MHLPLGPALQPDDRVLIHAGASGVGTALIQLIKLNGAKSYITSSSQKKIDFAKSIGAEDGFNYKEGDWVKDLMAATDGNCLYYVISKMSMDLQSQKMRHYLWLGCHSKMTCSR